MFVDKAYRESKPLFNRGRIGWALFDWANQAFTTIVITWIFAAYFADGIVQDGVAGQSMWNAGMGFSALAVAILAPVLGSIADRGGRRRPWVIGFSAMCIALTCSLYFMLPDPQFAMTAIILVALANICYEMAIVFNNAMLADLVDRPRLAKLGGIAWSGGYYGGLVSLVLCLAAVFVLPDPSETQVPVRITSVIVAVWFALFLIPFILWTPDKRPTGVPMAVAVREGLSSLWNTLRSLFSNDRNIFMYLLGRMTYTDGVNTIFVMGGVYASARYGLDTMELIQFGILLNVFSGTGGMVFAFFEERLGTKSVIMISILGLIVSGSAMLLAPDFSMFTVYGCILGVFVGPIQQASRTMMAKLAPADAQAKLFGLYALSGKATSWGGPILVGVMTAMAASWGWSDNNALTFGMFGVMPFMVAGFIIMLFVRSAPKTEA